MANDWYVKINNVEHGPLTSEKLKQLAQQGKVTPETFIKKGQSGTWLRAKHVTRLFPMAASAGMPATAVPKDVPASISKPAEMSRAAFDGPVAPPSPPPVAESPWARDAHDGSAALQSPATKACPFCGETILSVAKKCKHCGEFLDHGSPAVPHIAASSRVKEIEELTNPELVEAPVSSPAAQQEDAFGFLSGGPPRTAKLSRVAAISSAQAHRSANRVTTAVVVVTIVAVVSGVLIVMMQGTKSAKYVVHRHGMAVGNSPSSDEYLEESGSWTPTKDEARRFEAKAAAEEMVWTLKEAYRLKFDTIGLAVFDFDVESEGQLFHSYDVTGFFCCGLPLLFFVGSIVLAILQSSRMRRCPACAKEVSPLAKVCPHCGHPLR